MSLSVLVYPILIRVGESGKYIYRQNSYLSKNAQNSRESDKRILGGRSRGLQLICTYHITFPPLNYRCKCFEIFLAYRIIFYIIKQTVRILNMQSIIITFGQPRCLTLRRGVQQHLKTTTSKFNCFVGDTKPKSQNGFGIISFLTPSRKF